VFQLQKNSFVLAFTFTENGVLSWWGHWR